MGNVRFVSGKLTAGNHVPVVFYLTNKNGLKDIIIIVSDSDNIGGPIAAVWLQNANKSFNSIPRLNQFTVHSSQFTVKVDLPFVSLR